MGNAAAQALGATGCHARGQRCHTVSPRGQETVTLLSPGRFGRWDEKCQGGSGRVQRVHWVSQGFKTTPPLLAPFRAAPPPTGHLEHCSSCAPRSPALPRMRAASRPLHGRIWRISPDGRCICGSSQSCPARWLPKTAKSFPGDWPGKGRRTAPTSKAAANMTGPRRGEADPQLWVVGPSAMYVAKWQTRRVVEHKSLPCHCLVRTK